MPKLAELHIMGFRTGRSQAGIEKAMAAKSALSTAVTALSKKRAELGITDASDARTKQLQLQSQINQLTREVSDLIARYQRLNKGSSAPTGSKEGKSIDDFPLLSNASNVSKKNKWREVRMYQEINSDYTVKPPTTSSLDSSAVNINLFIPPSDQSSFFRNKTQNIEIGFRVAMVKVERGNWFQPQFLKQSKTYYHLNDEIRWTTYPEGAHAPEDVTRNPANYALLNQGVLPAYPAGYLICKVKSSPHR